MGQKMKKAKNIEAQAKEKAEEAEEKKEKIKKAKEKVRKKTDKSERDIVKRLKRITGKEVKTPKIKEENLLKNPEALMVKGTNPKKLDKVISDVRKNKGRTSRREIEEICKKHGLDPRKTLNVPATALGRTGTGRKWARWETKEFLDKIKGRKTELGGYTEGEKYAYINPEKSKKEKEIAKMHEGIHNALGELKKRKEMSEIPQKVEEALTSYLTSLSRIEKGEKKEKVIKDLERRIKLPQGDANRRGMEAAKKMLEEYKPREAEETFQRIIKGEASDPQRRLRRIIEEKELVKGKRMSPVRKIEKKKTKRKKGILGRIKEKIFG